MATITLDYDGRNGFAQKLIDTVLASKLFVEVRPKTRVKRHAEGMDATLKAIDELRSGKGTHCATFKAYKIAVK